LAAVAKRYAADPTVGRSKAAAVRSAYAGRTPAEVDEARARLHPGGLKQCRRCRTWQRFTAFATSTLHDDQCDLVAAHQGVGVVLRPLRSVTIEISGHALTAEPTITSEARAACFSWRPSPDPRIGQESQNQNAFSASPVRWDTLTPIETATHLQLLDAWLDWLIPRYGLDHRTVPDCWQQHGAPVEELSALHTAWLSAYALTSPGGSPLAWHAAFATARIRLADWIAKSGCRPAVHRKSP
jgi:hypothetical protein